MTAAANRSRAIRLARPATGDELQALQDKLKGLAAIKKTACKARPCKATPKAMQIDVHYDFPEITIGEILASISALLDRKCFTPVQRFYFFIASYMEENEKDHLLRPSIWQGDVQYMYARYFDRQQQNKQAAYKKQWQKYAPKHDKK